MVNKVPGFFFSSYRPTAFGAPMVRRTRALQPPSHVCVAGVGVGGGHACSGPPSVHLSMGADAVGPCHAHVTVSCALFLVHSQLVPMTGYNRVVQQARSDVQDITDGVSGVPDDIANQ
jgi:hypothetical protein